MVKRITVDKFVQILLALIFLVLFGFCVSTLNRGFEITDESYSLLLAIYSHVFKIFVSASHWVTSGLWAMAGNLHAYRALGLAVLLAGGLILALGSIQACLVCDILVKPGIGNRIAIISSTFVSALHWESYGATIYFTLSYNLLAIAGSYAAVGLTLLGTGNRGQWVRVFNFMAGLCLGVVFLCKFPSGIIVFFLTMVLVTMLSFSLRERVVGVLLALLGMGLCLLVITFSQMSPTDALQQFKLDYHFTKLR